VPPQLARSCDRIVRRAGQSEGTMVSRETAPKQASKQLLHLVLIVHLHRLLDPSAAIEPATR